MSSMPSFEPAYLLHRRAYRETSLIVDVYTMHHGRMALLVKGARSARSQNKSALLQPAQPLLLRWVGRGQLPNLTHIDTEAPPYAMHGLASFALMYVNELMLRLTQPSDVDADLFVTYAAMLAALAKQNSSAALAHILRTFEYDLLAAIGHPLPSIAVDCHGETLHASAWYRLEPQQGLVATAQPDKRSIRGDEWQHFLQMLHQDSMPTWSAEQQRRFRHAFRYVIHAQLHGKPLQSWQLLRDA